LATEALVLAGSPSPEPLVFPEPPTRLRDRVDLGGVLVDAVDFDQAAKRIEMFLRHGRPHQIVTVNLDFLSIAQRQPEFLDTLNGADLAVPDGMPLVWLSQWKGTPLTERVAGVELFGACCEIAVEQDAGVFLLGAAPGVAEQAAANLEERYPGLRVVGTYAPPQAPLTEEEDARMVAAVRAARPEFLFVALGAPRQDLWIRDHLDELGVPVCMGVGCVLDLQAGVATRAPDWMQHYGLEWAYRLVREPGRLWRRYLVDDLPTLARLFVTVRETPRDDVVAAYQ
jgi:N-acetylglucosaminyldiphosphoundecaprenol N-acetyl-beta-D-mannosaminyltransferase